MRVLTVLDELTDPDDPEEPLNEQVPNTYYVIVVDEDTIQLAEAPSILFPSRRTSG